MEFSNYIIIENDTKNLDIIPTGDIPVTLFLGRFQPFHIGHLQTIKDLKEQFPKNKVLVAIIKGKKSSKDKERNPLSFDYQKELILSALGNLKSSVIIYNKPFEFGYLPVIFKELREDGYEVDALGSGEDRILGMEKIAKDLNSMFQSVNIKIKETKRYVAASDVREFIRNNDYDNFKKSMPRALWHQFDKMQDLIK